MGKALSARLRVIAKGFEVVTTPEPVRVVMVPPDDDPAYAEAQAEADRLERDGVPAIICRTVNCRLRDDPEEAAA